jgi:hypothetical protein
MILKNDTLKTHQSSNFIEELEQILSYCFSIDEELYIFHTSFLDSSFFAHAFLYFQNNFAIVNLNIKGDKCIYI